jgi:hypothetical protein
MPLRADEQQHCDADVGDGTGATSSTSKTISCNKRNCS